MGDFNDDKCEITKNKPLTFKIFKILTLKHNKTKALLSLNHVVGMKKIKWGHFDFSR